LLPERDRTDFGIGRSIDNGDDRFSGAGTNGENIGKWFGADCGSGEDRQQR
jgi:hypothetical protein